MLLSQKQAIRVLRPASSTLFTAKQSGATKTQRALQLESSPAATSRVRAMTTENPWEAGNGVYIDGSQGEGGGQILRNSSALAAITGQMLRIDKIRAGRDKPGLRPQHLTGLKLIELLCCGALEGGKVNSTSITLTPGTLRSGRYVGDTGTAGSCTLMAQAAVPCLLFANPASEDGPAASVLELRGGTDADKAPPVGYLIEVLAPLLRSRLGLDFTVSCIKRGFYPRGGGLVEVSVGALPAGATIPAINLTERGQVTRVVVKVFTAGKVARTAGERMAAAAAADLAGGLGHGVALERQVVEETRQTAEGDGAGIIIIAETDTGCLLGASAKGERGVPAEATGSIAAAELLGAIQSGACVDEWMQDQLIIFMALAAGSSRMLCCEPTLHTRSAILVAQQLLPVKFTIRKAGEAEGTPAGLWFIECEGAGLTAPSMPHG